LVSRPLEGDDGIVSACDFLSAIELLFVQGLNDGFPLRGCIGFGDLVDDLQRNIFLSQTLPKLVSAEKEQEWTGVTVLPEAAGQLLMNLYGGNNYLPPTTGSNPIVHFPVPMKRGVTAPMWCLNWVKFCDEPIITSGLARLIDAKKPNTAAFIDYVRTLPILQTTLDPKMAPAKLVRARYSRKTYHMKFFDDNGCGIDPPGGFVFGVDNARRQIYVLPGDTPVTSVSMART
jgi:hypothetical protein